MQNLPSLRTQKTRPSASSVKPSTARWRSRRTDPITRTAVASSRGPMVRRRAVGNSAAKAAKCRVCSQSLADAAFRVWGASCLPGNDIAELTSCELDVLTLIGKGLSNKEIADELCISGVTAKATLAESSESSTCRTAPPRSSTPGTTISSCRIDRFSLIDGRPRRSAADTRCRGCRSGPLCRRGHG